MSERGGGGGVYGGVIPGLTSPKSVAVPDGRTAAGIRGKTETT